MRGVTGEISLKSRIAGNICTSKCVKKDTCFRHFCAVSLRSKFNKGRLGGQESGPCRRPEHRGEGCHAREEETRPRPAAQGTPSDDLPAAGGVFTGVCARTFPPADPGRLRGAGQEPVREGGA